MSTKIQYFESTKGKNMVSPIGKSLWCQINPSKPNDYEGNKSLLTELVLDPTDEQVIQFMNQIKGYIKTGIQELKDKSVDPSSNLSPNIKNKVKNSLVAVNPFKKEVDKDGNETGNIIFKVKLNNLDMRIEAGTRSTVSVVDAFKKPMKDNTIVPNGSKIRVVFYIRPYAMVSGSNLNVGASFMFNAIQVIELAEMSGEGNTKDVDLFDVIDTGFKSEEMLEEEVKEKVKEEEVVEEIVFADDDDF